MILNIAVRFIIIMVADIQQAQQNSTYIESLNACKYPETGIIVVTILCRENKEALEKFSHLPEVNYCSRRALGLESRVSYS